MFFVFITGLLLLSAVFGMKLVEVRRGSKIVLVQEREKADKKLSILRRQLQQWFQNELLRFREIWLRSHWTVRRSMAENLRRLARHLHN